MILITLARSQAFGKLSSPRGRTQQSARRTRHANAQGKPGHSSCRCHCPRGPSEHKSTCGSPVFQHSLSPRLAQRRFHLMPCWPTLACVQDAWPRALLTNGRSRSRKRSKYSGPGGYGELVEVVGAGRWIGAGPGPLEQRPPRASRSASASHQPRGWHGSSCCRRRRCQEAASGTGVWRLCRPTLCELFLSRPPPRARGPKG